MVQSNGFKVARLVPKQGKEGLECILCERELELPHKLVLIENIFICSDYNENERYGLH